MVESQGTGDSVEDDITLLDLALVVAENLKLIILLPLAAGFLALALSFAMPTIFTATTRVLPPAQHSLAASLASQLGALTGATNLSTSIKNPTEMYVAMLQSRTITDRLIVRYGLKQLYGAKFDEQIRMKLASRTKVSSGRDGLITVSVDDEDPRRAANLANAYVAELQELTQTLAITEASQRRLFFERQMKQAAKDLTQAEQRLQGGGIGQATLNAVPQSALEFVAGLRARVTAQEIKLASMRGFMTDSNPEFKNAHNELMALRAQLNKAEQTTNGGKEHGNGADYIARLRDFKYHETLYELMAKQHELARLEEARDSSVIQVLDPALPPDLKSGPKRSLIAIVATAVTFLITLLSVFVLEGFRKTAGDPSAASKLARLRQLLRFKRS